MGNCGANANAIANQLERFHVHIYIGVRITPKNTGITNIAPRIRYLGNHLLQFMLETRPIVIHDQFSFSISKAIEFKLFRAVKFIPRIG